MYARLKLETKSSFDTSMFAKRRFTPFSSAFLFLFAISAVPQTGASDTTATVPFIGCQSDGQVDPLDAPKGSNKVVHISKEAAQRLAFYKAERGFGVLAPRGWYCFGTYGSSGVSLFVSPQPINATTLFSDSWKGFTGPAIQISVEEGDTSGRFEVARIIARVFPSHRAFVHRVTAEGIEPARNFPFGPYPKDKLVYKSKGFVEYETPLQTDGLGTQSRLQKNADPIRGVAVLIGQEPSLLFLAALLSPEMAKLTSAIIQQTEYDAAQPEQ
jgi:hypothetical protein